MQCCVPIAIIISSTVEYEEKKEYEMNGKIDMAIVLGILALMMIAHPAAAISVGFAGASGGEYFSTTVEFNGDVEGNSFASMGPGGFSSASRIDGGLNSGDFNLILSEYMTTNYDEAGAFTLNSASVHGDAGSTGTVAGMLGSTNNAYGISSMAMATGPAAIGYRFQSESPLGSMAADFIADQFDYAAVGSLKEMNKNNGMWQIAFNFETK
jgi:hypothetical protein